MQKVKIYDVKTNSSPNAQRLLSPDGKYFFWNNAKFLGNNIDDNVFFIDRQSRLALFTRLELKDISTEIDRVNNQSRFSDENNNYGHL